MTPRPARLQVPVHFGGIETDFRGRFDNVARQLVRLVLHRILSLPFPLIAASEIQIMHYHDAAVPIVTTLIVISS